MPIIYNPYKKKGFFKVPSGGTKKAIDASFTYSASTFTQADADPTPTITGTAGGTFSGTSGLVFVSTSTGEIDLSASTIASHVVTYTVDGVSSNFNLSVTAAPFTNTKSVDYDGVDDYLEITKTAALTTASLSMWVKVSGNFGANERQSLASNDDYNHGRNFMIADPPTTTNDAYISMFAGAIIYGKTSASGGIPINDGNWHHLVWTYDGSAGSSASINMYVDGQNQYSNASYSSYWSYEIKFQYFGKPTAANTYFSGKTDEIAFFNTILSSSDVSAIYNSGNPTSLTAYSPLGWFRCGDGDTFPTLTDNGSASSNATMTNMTSGDIVSDTP